MEEATASVSKPHGPWEYVAYCPTFEDAASAAPQRENWKMRERQFQNQLTKFAYTGLLHL